MIYDIVNRVVKGWDIYGKFPESFQKSRKVNPGKFPKIPES